MVRLQSWQFPQLPYIFRQIYVYGGDFDGFYWDVKEKTHSLLMFDIVQADVSISDELKEEIEKDGVVIYEKA